MQNANNEDVIELDLQELLGLLLNKLWLIVICGIVAGVIGFLVSTFAITPMYESTTKVYILNKSDTNQITYSDLQMGTQLTADYAQLIKGRDVLERVIETCALNESYESFSNRVQVETLTNTRIIAITVEDEQAVMAQFIADEIRKVAAEHIKTVMDIQAVNVAEEANLPKEPASPSVMKWTVIGAFIGIFLCALIIIIRFLVDDTIKTSEDIEKYLGLSTLAMIPIIGQEDKHRGRGRKKAEEVIIEEIVPDEFRADGLMSESGKVIHETEELK